MAQVEAGRPRGGVRSERKPSPEGVGLRVGRPGSCGLRGAGAVPAGILAMPLQAELKLGSFLIREYR